MSRERYFGRKPSQSSPWICASAQVAPVPFLRGDRELDAPFQSVAAQSQTSLEV